MVETAEGAGTPTPPDRGNAGVPTGAMPVPAAIAWINDTLDAVILFTQMTPYLTTTINTHDGEEEMHPGGFIVSNLKKMRAHLFQTYGEEMWADGLRQNRRLHPMTIVPHPRDDYTRGE